jgi:hypothetical protein
LISESGLEGQDRYRAILWPSRELKLAVIKALERMPHSYLGTAIAHVPTLQRAGTSK